MKEKCYKKVNHKWVEIEEKGIEYYYEVTTNITYSLFENGYRFYCLSRCLMHGLNTIRETYYWMGDELK